MLYYFVEVMQYIGLYVVSVRSSVMVSIEHRSLQVNGKKHNRTLLETHIQWHSVREFLKNKQEMPI